MLVSEVLGRVRSLLADYNTLGRYGDSELFLLFNQAQLALATELRWPVGLQIGMTTGGQQEYALPELLTVERAYLAGQLLKPTSIPLLQGDQIGYYDQSGDEYQPAWVAADATSYPVDSYRGSATSFGMPYMPGERPQWYLRGGYIGFVPAPSGVYQMSLHTIAKPNIVSQDSDDSVFPYSCLSALAWWIVKQLMFSDDRDNRYGLAANEFENAQMQARSALNQLNPNLPSGPIVRTQRSVQRRRLRGGRYGDY